MTIECLNNNTGYITDSEPWHPKKNDGVFFKIEGCNDCRSKVYFKRFMKNKDENFKFFEVSLKLQQYIQQSEMNLSSIKGIEMRVTEVPRLKETFGVIKPGYTV